MEKETPYQITKESEDNLLEAKEKLGHLYGGVFDLQSEEDEKDYFDFDVPKVKQDIDPKMFERAQIELATEAFMNENNPLYGLNYFQWFGLSEEARKSEQIQKLAKDAVSKALEGGTFSHEAGYICDFFKLPEEWIHQEAKRIIIKHLKETTDRISSDAISIVWGLKLPYEIVYSEEIKKAAIGTDFYTWIDKDFKEREKK